MKRTTLLLITAFYLLSCMGMGISRFYCCGKLASVTLTYGADDNAGKADKNGCCKHINQSLKLKDSHFNTAAVSLNHPAPLILPSFTLLHNVAIVNQAFTNIVYKGNGPPRSCVISKYTLNCAYRI